MSDDSVDTYDYEVDGELAILQQAWEQNIEQLKKDIGETEQAVVDSSMEIARLRGLINDARADYKTAVEDLGTYQGRLRTLEDNPPTREDAERRLLERRNEPRSLPGIETGPDPDDPTVKTSISVLKLNEFTANLLSEHIPSIVTIGDLQKAIIKGQLSDIKGLGEKRIRIIKDALQTWSDKSN